MDDELTGVAGWNEFPDQVVVLGRQRDAAGNLDVFAAKWFLDTTAANYSPTNPTTLRAMRSITMPGTGKELVAELPVPLYSGQAHGWAGTASGHGGAFEPGPTIQGQLPLLGAPFGGGVAVDSRGRTTTVGGTFGTDYRVQGGGRYVSVSTSTQANLDAVRTELDLLPDGVCRSDQTSGLFPPLYAPSSGNGGTTPVAALAPFGNQIGSPPGTVQRMLIDFEGECQAGSPAAILIDRPPTPATSLAYASFLQLGIPGPAPLSFPTVMPGVEVWTNNSPVTVPYLPHAGSLRIPLWSGGLPLGSYAFTAQFFAALTGPVPYVASPALIFSY